MAMRLLIERNPNGWKFDFHLPLPLLFLLLKMLPLVPPDMNGMLPF